LGLAVKGRLSVVTSGLATEHEASEAELVAGLRRGEEEAFVQVVRLYDPGLRRMARLYASDGAAEDAVQDTWLTVLRGIDRFEGRSTLKTWIYGILVNVARRQGGREGRTIPFAAAGAAVDASEGAVSPSRLQHPELGTGYWPASPMWARNPEAAALAGETRTVVLRAIAALPPAQHEVIMLRDVEDWSAAETCEVLGISDLNQRTLLHRARVAVRRALEVYLDE
jgi:RNA polymerase sigma-70 factor, ECF subfamily